MKIDRVRAVHVKTEWDYHGPLGEDSMTRPLHIYEGFKEKEQLWGPISKTLLAEGPPYPVSGYFLIIDTDEGASGVFGPIGDEDVAIIQRYFAELLIGENPHAVERIWDKMYRHGIHARKGTPMMALSKVDLALWDLKGKLLNAPTYVLLGGPSRDKIRAYASMLGYSVEPEKVAERVKEVVAEGYTATKWFLPCDPKDGEAGIRKNVEVIKAAREAAGPDVDLMFDAWNSWNIPYTLRMIEETRDYHPYWFEEVVMADMIPQYAEVRRNARGVFISGGEHEYTLLGHQSTTRCRSRSYPTTRCYMGRWTHRDDKNLCAGICEWYTCYPASW